MRLIMDAGQRQTLADTAYDTFCRTRSRHILWGSNPRDTPARQEMQTQLAYTQARASEHLLAFVFESSNDLHTLLCVYRDLVQALYSYLGEVDRAMTVAP